MRARLALALALAFALVGVGLAHAAPLSETACGPAAPFTSLPTDLAKVQGLVPLGNMNPKGHTIPTRHVYFYPKPLQTLPVAAPGNADVVAVEYHPGEPDWSIHLKPCKTTSLYFFHVDELSPALAAAVGDINVGSADFMGDFRAKPMLFPVVAGALLGKTKQTLDMGVQDFALPPLSFVNQARYKVDIPALLASIGLGGNPIAIAVAPRIVPQSLYARCPADYFFIIQRAQLTAIFSDYDGVPAASGIPQCHSNMQDVAGSARGNWWNDTDPLHDALLHEENALGLAPWNVTPSTQLFSLNENVPGWSKAWLEGAPADGNNVLLEFPIRPGPQKTNRRFEEITDDAVYCYDLVRAHRGGRALKGVILLQVSDGPTGKRGKLQIEFVRTSRCPALASPYTFKGHQATFHR